MTASRFRKIVNVPRSDAKQNTVSFPPVRRPILQGDVPDAAPGHVGLGDATSPFRRRSRRTRSRARAAHRRARQPLRREGGVCAAGGLRRLPTPEIRRVTRPQGGVVDLTAKMRPDGTLDWTPPPGEWVVLRMGYSLLGITNHPASPEGTGFEVDKLNPGAREGLHDTYLDHYTSAVARSWGARTAVPDQRQLGGRRSELDGRHARGVHEAPRLRSAPVAARAHRTGRRERRGQRSLPVGLASNALRHASRVPLRPNHGRSSTRAAWATTASRTTGGHSSAMAWR